MLCLELALARSGSNIVALRFGDQGTKVMLAVVCLNVRRVGFKLRAATTPSNMQQGVQMDTNYNIQQCLQEALKNCRFYERVLPAKCPLRIRIECRGFAAKAANSRL